MSLNIIKPLMSVKEARKILGADFDMRGDDEVMGIIIDFQRMAGGILDSVKVPNSDKDKNE